MPIKILGLDGVTPAGVEASLGSLITTPRPDADRIITYESLSAQSGLMTNVGGGAAVFALRYFGQDLLAVRRAGLGFTMRTAFATAQMISFALLGAKQYQQFETGGTQIFPIPNSINLQHHNMKHRQGFSHLSACDIRISSTANLVASAQRATDTNNMGIVGGYASGVGVAIPLALDNLMTHAPGDYPHILRFNEGLLIVVATVSGMGSGGVGVMYVNLEVAEIPEY